MTENKTGELCKTCANTSCYNRKPYKKYCSSYKKANLSSKDFPSGYANSERGHRLRHRKEEIQLAYRYYF